MKLTAQHKADILIAALQNLDKLMFEIDSIEDDETSFGFSHRTPILPITIKDLTFTMYLEASLTVSGYETPNRSTWMDHDPGERVIEDVDDDGNTFLSIQFDGEDVFDYSIMDNIVDEIVIPMIRENNVNK